MDLIPNMRIFTINLFYSDEDGYENVYSFAHTSEGNWLCFDYRDSPTTSEPKISFSYS